MRTTSIVALAIVLAGCRPPLASYVKVGDVALGRVVVYRNGVAYYERRAQVRGGQLTVSVPRDRVDDFLKSLTVVDARTQQPLPVSIPRQQSEGGAYLDMTLALPGNRPADVLLTYVTESTAWKPSYRLVLGADHRVMLEGWAIVDNLSGEDWNDVMVGVGSSAAMSFRYDLWSVRNVAREALASDAQFAVAPPTAVSPYGASGAAVGESIGNLEDTEIRRPTGHPEATPGVSFSGSTSVENSYVVDGINTTATTAENNRLEQPTVTSGVVRGRVTDQATGMGLAGVTVVATSPARSDARTEITDEAGVFQLGGLPPGTYLITFFFGDATIERNGVVVAAGKTAPVFQKIDTAAMGSETIQISDHAPMIDPTSTTTGVTLDRQYTRRVPTRGRRFQAALGSAAGTQGAGPSTPAPVAPSPIKSGDDKLARLVPDLIRRQQPIVVEGYAAPGDADPHARALDRANIVRNQLIDAGLPPALVRAESRGRVAGHNPGVWLVTAPATDAAGRSTAAAASPAELAETPVGESHFQSETPMTVARGTSAMVSMLRAETAGEEVYLYDAESARGNLRFAFKAVRLRNPTDSTLEAGPVTVYGDKRYIGEGITEAIPPRAAVVVPFALDRQVVVERADDVRDELSRLVTLQRGVLTAEVQHVRRTRLTLTSRLPTASRVYVRHTVEPGWKLLDSELPVERLGEARLFEVALDAGQTRTIELAEATPVMRTLDLGADATLAMMQVFVDSPRPDPTLKRQLAALLAIHRELVDAGERIHTLRDQLAEYRVRAAELTDQIHGLRRVKRADTLVRSLAAKATETSDRVQAATLAIVTTQDQLMLARVRFQDALAELSLTDAIALAASPVSRR